MAALRAVLCSWAGVAAPFLADTADARACWPGGRGPWRWPPSRTAGSPTATPVLSFLGPHQATGFGTAGNAGREVLRVWSEPQVDRQWPRGLRPELEQCCSRKALCATPVGQ